MPTLAAAAFALSLAVAVAAPPAAAEAEAEAGKGRTHQQCARDYDACQKDCATKHADDEVKRAACVPVCSGRYAACDAAVAYEKARPWLEDKAEKTKKFLEDLMKDVPGYSDPPPKPKQPDSI